MATLLSCLSDTETRPLQFGTSGRRGLLRDLSQLELAINVWAELQFLQSLPIDEGGIVTGDTVYLAYDLRPSSSTWIDSNPARGELAQAMVWAIRQAGMIPQNLGTLPTPALAFHALSQGKACMMVTGSHIPFDRNGYKTYTAIGELSKAHEHPIAEHVARIRQQLYGQSREESCFGADGQFKTGSQPLPEASPLAVHHYRQRTVDFFGSESLSGLNIMVYQHSAVGRDLLADLLADLGAEVLAVGRSEQFIPVDTENMDQTRLAELQTLYDQSACGQHFDAVVSTDGDSDRPLLLGITPDTAQLHFIPGDRLGMLTALYLKPDAVVVPISCNDAIDRTELAAVLQSKTRIGSPYVIAGMEQARQQGKLRICGFEANGGFLTGSDFERKGRVLKALPTRDAVLPLVAVLAHCRQQNVSVLHASQQLPKRYGHSGLIRDFPRTLGQALVRRYSPQDASITALYHLNNGWVAHTHTAPLPTPLPAHAQDTIQNIIQPLALVFSPELGFGELISLNVLDGLRLGFSNGDVAHIRPSGNADELRIYAVADTPARAVDITDLALAEPDGLLRRLINASSTSP